MVTRTKKIFVGGLSAPTTLEDVKNYFEQFGPTYDIVLRKSTADKDESRAYTFAADLCDWRTPEAGIEVCVTSMSRYRPVPYVRAFQMKTVLEYQMSHLNTEHNEYAHLKQRPPGRVHATPS
ncbi:RNA-binding protein Musashi Rbp6 [Danaus plexippus plexippus]|uniref:RNA-binding protein Musashi Rbp6 n=1 Tax=Danaus plexippus plexippus TaxID=278856 RepID=A0A212F374_DANPL|nr:RNA-binding protein Musashi Rbp6 [Danaus plexippus plexippus]